MVPRDEERDRFVKKAEGREAGVADLLELYIRTEQVHSAASRALEEQTIAVASNTTNRTQPQRAHLG